MEDRTDISGTRELIGPTSLADAKQRSDALWLAVIMRPLDFEPYGLRVRDGADCSCGCRHFLPLEGEFRLDWGVCTNAQSHRCGLLTWEHMGCPHFEASKTENGETDDNRAA